MNNALGFLTNMTKNLAKTETQLCQNMGQVLEELLERKAKHQKSLLQAPSTRNLVEKRKEDLKKQG